MLRSCKNYALTIRATDPKGTTLMTLFSETTLVLLSRDKEQKRIESIQMSNKFLRQGASLKKQQ